MIRPRRSVLYTPGDNPRALLKARELACDSLILDLEDAIPPEHKVSARVAIGEAVTARAFGPREVVIRVNAPDSAWLDDDLAMAANARPDAVLLPKVMTREEIAQAKAKLGGIALWAMIETPRAVLDIDKIAGGGVAALVLGANDLLKYTGGRHTRGREALATAMSLTILAARAHGIVALDGVHNDIGDGEGFQYACIQARNMGFDGKTVVHPAQIDGANAAFTPTAEEIAEARAIVAAFDDHPGKAVVAFRGRMIERLDAEIAGQTLALAQAVGAG